MSFVKLVVAAFLLLVPAASWASCTTYNAEISQSGGTGYSPADVIDRFANIAIRAPSRPGSDCRGVAVTIRPRSGVIELRNGGDLLAARFVTIGATGGVSGSSYTLGPIAAGDLVRTGAINLPFLRLDAGQFITPGQYVGEFDLVIGDGPPIPFSVNVQVEAAIRLIGNQSSRTLALGEITNGAETSDRFFYRTNSAVAVSIRSQNGGVMLHSGGSAFGSIPYAFYLSGRLVALDQPTSVQIAYRQLAVQSEEVRLVVAPQQDKYAGIYQDVISLDFAAF